MVSADGDTIRLTPDARLWPTHFLFRPKNLQPWTHGWLAYLNRVQFAALGMRPRRQRTPRGYHWLFGIEP